MSADPTAGTQSLLGFMGHWLWTWGVPLLVLVGVLYLVHRYVFGHVRSWWDDAEYSTYGPRGAGKCYEATATEYRRCEECRYYDCDYCEWAGHAGPGRITSDIGLADSYYRHDQW